jgi:hypothetical protein
MRWIAPSSEHRRSGLRQRLKSYALAYANSDFARDGS